MSFFVYGWGQQLKSLNLRLPPFIVNLFLSSLFFKIPTLQSTCDFPSASPFYHTLNPIFYKDKETERRC